MLKTKLFFSDVLLIIINLIPLAGVLFSGWDTKQMFVVYCLESVIIGFYNVVKMIIVSFREKAEDADVDGETVKMSGVFFIIFFILSYGLFCYISLGIFSAIAHLGAKPYDPFSFFMEIPQYLTYDGRLVLYIFLGVHGIRMFDGFIYSGQYKIASLNDLLLQPFSRVILTQAIVFVGVMFLQFVYAKLFMIIFVGVRMVVDIYISIRNYKKQCIVEFEPDSMV